MVVCNRASGSHAFSGYCCQLLATAIKSWVSTLVTCLHCGLQSKKHESPANDHFCLRSCHDELVRACQTRNGAVVTRPYMVPSIDVSAKSIESLLAAVMTATTAGKSRLQTYDVRESAHQQLCYAVIQAAMIEDFKHFINLLRRNGFSEASCWSASCLVSTSIVLATRSSMF